MAERPVVALLGCEDYDPARVEDALRRALDLLGGMGRYVQPSMRVVLKPNLLRAMPPEAAATTHPSVVRAVVRLVQACGATAVIAESPGGPFTPVLLRRLYEKTGMRQVAEETGAELSYDTSVARVPNPEGSLLRLVEVIAPVANADAVINLPKLKSHNLTRLTAATKNLFGVIPGATKLGYHAKLQDGLSFSRGLIDILRCVAPVLSVTDAIVAMALVGWEPLSMPTIKVATEWGLTTGRLDDVEILGDALEERRFRGFRPGSATAVDPGLLPRGLRRLLMPAIAAHSVNGCPAQSGGVAAEALDVGTVPSGIRGWATRQLIVSPQAGPRCTGCGYCAQHCPVGAIAVVRGRAAMDPRRCIRCYCCHELCPQLAVELRRPWLGRLFFGQ